MTAPRIFFYVQHLLGIGHLARASRIATALAEDDFDVTVSPVDRMLRVFQVPASAPLRCLQSLPATQVFQALPTNSAARSMKRFCTAAAIFCFRHSMRPARTSSSWKLFRLDAGKCDSNSCLCLTLFQPPRRGQCF
jgi:hypothetical protein